MSLTTNQTSIRAGLSTNMVNQVAIIVTIAIMISLFGVIFQTQGASGRRVHFIVIPAGSNTTSTSNMTGSNTTLGMP